MTTHIATVFDLAILLRDAAMGCAVLAAAVLAAAVLAGRGVREDRRQAALLAVPVRTGARRPRA